MNLQNPRGTKDLLPDEKIVRDSVISKLKDLFERFGFNPLETPAIEMYDTLANKFTGGEEILKEIYTLKDQGGRELGLRYDLTVPFARVIAMNPTLKKPFKRYQIGSVWRDGPIKLGRAREFVQCDADIVGSTSLLADAELLAMAEFFFKELNLDVKIYVNNMKLLKSLLLYAGVPDDKLSTAILTVDKLKKIGENGVIEELISKGIQQVTAEEVIEVFKLAELPNNMLLDKLSKLFDSDPGLNEVKDLFNYCKLFNLKNIRLDISLARGLAYYTGTVFEVFLEDNSFSSSLCAGGRYDDMIGKLIDSDPVPAVGISFGLVPIIEVMKMNDLIKSRNSLTQVYVVPIKTYNESVKIVSKLRDNGINSDLDLNERSISKNLDFANSYNIPFVIIVGKKELDENKVTLKDMSSGEESLISVDDVIKKLLR